MYTVYRVFVESFCPNLRLRSPGSGPLHFLSPSRTSRCCVLRSHSIGKEGRAALSDPRQRLLESDSGDGGWIDSGASLYMMSAWVLLMNSVFRCLVDRKADI
jgi:hypothetical protein